MATIEPRLIHLLNDPTTPQVANADLPPLHSLPLPTSPDGPLPPLDRDGGHRADRSGIRSAYRGALISGSHGPVPVSHAGDELTYASHRRDVDYREGRYAGSGASYPLRLILGEGETSADQSHPLTNTLDEGQDLLDDASNKKRSRALHVKDDFVQLPQPVKKQKAAQPAPVMPPIINGLLEPPPHAALFPPISSNSFDDNDAIQISLLNEFNHNSEDRTGHKTSPEPEKNVPKSRKRATKPRRKWTEEETTSLLLGVNRHGVGKWTNILEDVDFQFNGRTAGDLKDRFRTCCPEELRNRKNPKQDGPASSKRKAKKGIYSENILIEDDEPSSKEPTASPPAGPPGQFFLLPKKKSRAHRKKMEDLAELGIHGPFKKSHRRERRPFTEQDDREILEGLEFYGPAWTKIQRDARFHLTSRQPTDLRDRVRNKYYDVYQRIEKGAFQTKDGRNDILEPSVSMAIDNSFKTSQAAPMHQPVSHRDSREDLPRWPFQMAETADYSHYQQAFEFGEPAAPPMTGGEMDISRLLLDDSRLTPVPARPEFEEGTSSRAASSPRKGHHKSHRR